MATDNKRKLYDALSQEYDLGSYENFCADLNDEGKRRKLYDATSNDYDYGSWDNFSRQLGYTGQQAGGEAPTVPERSAAEDRAFQASATMAQGDRDGVGWIRTRRRLAQTGNPQTRLVERPMIANNPEASWRGFAAAEEREQQIGVTAPWATGQLTPEQQEQARQVNAEIDESVAARTRSFEDAQRRMHRIVNRPLMPATGYSREQQIGDFLSGVKHPQLMGVAPTQQELAEARHEAELREAPWPTEEVAGAVNDFMDGGAQGGASAMQMRTRHGASLPEVQAGGRAPRPAGSTYENGRWVPQWELGDGRLTTNYWEADASERESRIFTSANMLVSTQLREAIKERERLQAKADARYKELENQSSEFESEHPVLALLTGTREAQTGISSVDQRLAADTEYQQYSAALHEIDERIQTLTNRRYAEDGGDVGFWHMFGQTLLKGDTWDMGLSGLQRTAALLQAASAPDTESAQALMKQRAQNAEVQQKYGDFGFFARAGMMSAEMLPFMLQFAWTGGGYSGMNLFTRGAGRLAARQFGTAALKEMAETGLWKYGKKYGLRGVARKADNWLIRATGTTADELLVRAPLMTNTVQAAQTVNDIVDRKLGDVTVDRKGFYNFANDQSWGSAIWQAEANSVIENYSEMFGLHLEGALPKLAQTFGGSRISGVLARAKKSDLGRIATTANSYLRRAGVSDYLGEVGEEYYGQLWRTMLDLDDSRNAEGVNLFNTGEFHGDIWGGMALSMGLIGAAKYTSVGAAYGVKKAVSGIEYAQLKHGMSNADTAARELFTPERWEPLRQQIEHTKNDEIGKLSEGIMADEDLSTEEKEAAMTYLEWNLNWRGMNLGLIANSRDDGDEPDVRSNVDGELSASYMDGYTAQDEQEMTDAQNTYNIQRERMEGYAPALIADLDADPVGTLLQLAQDGTIPETIDAARDYANAKQALDGIRQRMTDDVDELVTQSDAQIKCRVNKASGMIQPAKLGLNDRDVFIVGGRVTAKEDGTVDRENSDESLIVRDAQTGAMEFVDPKDLRDVGATLDPESERVAAAEAIRRQAAEQAEAMMRGLLAFNPGDAVSIGDGADGFLQGTIAGPVIDEGTGAVLDGLVTVDMQDGTQQVFKKQDLQTWADTQARARAEEFDRARRGEQPAGENGAGVAPQFKLNDEFSIDTGGAMPVRGSITAEADEDGLIEIHTEEPLNGQVINKVKPEELEGMLVSYKGAEVRGESAGGVKGEREEVRGVTGVADVAPELTVPKTGENVPESAETIQNPTESPVFEGETVPKTENSVETIQENPAHGAAPMPMRTVEEKGETRSVLERIPLNEKGKPDFGAVDADTAWDGLVEKTGKEELAQAFAENMQRRSEAEVKRLSASKSKSTDDIDEFVEAEGKRLAAVEQAKARLEHWKHVAGMKARRETAAAEAAAAEERRAAEGSKATGRGSDVRAGDSAEVHHTPGAVAGSASGRGVESTIGPFGEKNSALDNTTDTDKTHPGNGNDKATPENTVLSEGKGTSFVPEKQENGEESSEEVSRDEKARWAEFDKEVNSGLYEQTGLREGQVWTGRDGTRVVIGARGYVKSPDGWRFSTTIRYPDGRMESTIKPAADIADFFKSKGYELESDIVGRSLTEREAADLISELEESAEVAPLLDLTIENWDAEFGEDGIVNTPIGEVKMGENQFTKLMRQGRNGKLGMVKPTLENPDIIIEDISEAKDPDTTERKSSYVFVKAFVKPDGSRYYYFTSVTVSKAGHEVVVSNQEKRRNVLTNLLMKGKLVWKHADDVSDASDIADGLYSSQGKKSDPATESTDAPQTNYLSEGKVSDTSGDKQEGGEKSSGDVADVADVTDVADVAQAGNRQSRSAEQRTPAVPVQGAEAELPFNIGEDGMRNRETYDMAKGLVEAAGIPVVEVGAEEARAKAERAGKDVQLMGSRTDRKMAKIAEHYADKVLDDNQQAVVDVFSGKRDNVAIEVERADEEVHMVLQQGRENKAGTKHSLFRHFETRSNYYNIEEVALIPEIISKGQRNNNGKIITYDYAIGDGVRLRVTTELKAGKELFTNFIAKRKPPVSETQVPFGDTQLSAGVTDTEVSAAKVDNSDESVKDSGEKEAGGRRELRTAGGTVYGWVEDGKVYLNRDAMNPQTPVHEYTHLWDEMVRKENPELWARGKELLKQTPTWDEVMNDPNYADIRGDEDAVASEVHARLTGERGERVLSDMVERSKEDGVFAVADAVTLVDKIRGWLRDMFKALKGTFERWSRRELDGLTLEDFNNMTLRDLAEGVNPRSGDKNLVAVHNLSEEKLRKVLDLGGMPMPSVAITKAAMGHGEFGAVSFVFDKESVNPSDRRNKVYDGDAWTPTFPAVGYKLNAVRTSDIYARANKVGRLPMFRAVDFHPDNYERIIDGRRDASLVEAFRNDYGAKQFFLSENGTPVERYETREVEKYTADNIRLYEKMLETIGADRLRNESDERLEPELKRLIGEHRGKDFESMKPFVAKALIKNSVRKALDYADNGNFKTENDLEGTRAKIDKRINPEEYRRWLEEMFAGVVEKEGIRNDRDMFTPAGNQRPWESLYDAITLDNVVKAMQRQAKKGGSGLFGGNIFGASAKEFNDINEIRKEAAARIRSMSHEEYKSEKDRISARLEEVKLPSIRSFSDAMDFVGNVKDAVVKSDKATGIYRYLRSIYPDMTMDVANEIADIVSDIRKMSTRYFEAKPQRIVGLEEVKLAVVPEDTPGEIVGRLESLGIPVRTYERGNERQRSSIISQEASERGLRFHASSSAEAPDGDAVSVKAGYEGSVMREPETEYSNSETERGEVYGETKGVSDETDDEYVLFRPVTDEATLRRLNSEPTIKVYRAMQMIDGGLRPPMSGKVNGQWRDAIEVGVWEEAEEHPEMADENGRFKLDKGNGKSIKAAYNPYIHTSLSPINDQFSSGYSRPELVIVESEIPKSELTSGYHAEKAKDSVGEKEWKSGPVSRALAKVGQPRRVILSRWSRIIRVVPVEEVAEAYAQRLNAYGIEVPFNTVPPALRDALAARGVKIGKPEKGNAGQASMPAFEKWLREQELERLGDGYGAYSDAEVSYMNDPVSKVMGKNRFSKKQQAEFAARERRRMTEHVQRLAAKLNLKNVEIVDDGSQFEGRRAKAKGFFNPRTGKITIVIANHTGTLDVEQTLLHEAVAHYGLRQLCGKHFDTFLDNVYESAEPEIRRKIAALAAKNGWDFRTATEEYLAGLAEDMNFDEARNYGGWWSKIKQLFLDMLEKIGFVGFRDKTGIVLTDNELRYMLWRSYENLKEPGRRRGIFGEAEDVARQADMKVGNYAEGGIGADYAAEPMDVEETNEKFNEELQQQIDGTLPEGHVYDMGMPSKYLLSTGIEKLPIKLSAKVLNVKSNLERHSYNLESVRDLVNAIQKPWAIFSYGDKAKAQNLIVGIEDNGRQFLVGISINPTVKGRTLEINSIRNVFPKNNHEWINWITEGKLLRVDGKEEIQAIIAKLRMNPVAFDYLNLDNAAKVVKEFENPTIEEEELFRDGDFTPRDKALARDYYERMCRKGTWQFREAVQDSMLGLKTLYQAVLGEKTHIEDVAGFENAYTFENRMSSANNGEQHEYFVRYMKPLLNEIGRICGANERKRRDLTDYMMAKHGLERNEHMRAEAAANNENTNRDFAGLIGLTGEADWKSAEATARQWVDDYEKMVDTRALWKAVNAATKATLEKMYKSGMLSTEKYEEIRDMYEYYIPLRGWDEKTSDEVYGYLTSKEGPLSGSILKKAEGRSSKADDPIATIAMMADDGIRQGNRNVMKQRFLNFVLNHPSNLVSVQDLWLQYNDVRGEWVPVFADTDPNDTPEDVERKIAAFEERMTQLKEQNTDKYKRSREAQGIPYKVVKGNLKEHQVMVKRNGRTYVLTINGNPRAAQAINGLTNPDVDQGGVVSNMLKAGEWVNRQLSAFYTTRNPDFVVSNFFRDMLYSNCMTWVKENPAYALKFHKNFAKYNPVTMYKLLLKWEDGKLDMNNESEKLFYDFMINGGETGYTNVRDIESRKKEIAKELKKEESLARGAWAATGMIFDLANRSAENCARFAAFVTSRECGRSIDRSIYDAKEVSVNFNKKGSGGKMVNAVGQTKLGKLGSYVGGIGRLGLVFWNAGLQGMVNAGRAAKRHPGKAAVAASLGLFSLGFVTAMLNAMFGGGDDDDQNAYYNLPDYIRRSNLCIRAGKQSVSIPLPIEFRALYGLGELAYGVMSGNERYSASELAYELASQVSQLLPLDVLEGGGGWHAFVPSIAKPLVEAYSNRSWTGLPIYRDSPFAEYDPQWTKAYANANTQLVGFAKWLNELTGGNDYKQGWLDFNPARLEYLLKGYFGGMVTFPGKIIKSGETVFGDREFEWRNMPIANRLIKSGDERTAYRKLQNEYFNYKEEYEETQRLMRKYGNAAANGDVRYENELAALTGSELGVRYEIFGWYKKDLDAAYEAIAQETDREARKELEQERFVLMRELVDGMRDPGAFFKKLYDQGQINEDYQNYLEQEVGVRIEN